MKSVLTALEVHYGASHIEVMLTADGPQLIEFNGRVSGICHSSLMHGL